MRPPRGGAASSGSPVASDEVVAYAPVSPATADDSASMECRPAVGGRVEAPPVPAMAAAAAAALAAGPAVMLVPRSTASKWSCVAPLCSTLSRPSSVVVLPVPGGPCTRTKPSCEVKASSVAWRRARSWPSSSGATLWSCSM
eukprot:scaffold22069_cov122-Isochrysis_galbana.AAC.6